MARRRRYRPPYRRRRRGIPVGRYVILFLALATAIWWMLPDSREDAEIGNTDSIITKAADEDPGAASGPSAATDRSQVGLLAATSADDETAADESTGRDRQRRSQRRRNLGNITPSEGGTDSQPSANMFAQDEQTQAESTVPTEDVVEVPATISAPAGQTALSASAGWRERMLAGDQAHSSGDLITARAHYSAAILGGASGQERDRLRGILTEIGFKTIFSQRVLPGDKLVEKYTIKVGDSLGKIAKKYMITPELLASVNGIQDMNLIRAGQDIKVVRGPFRAVVDKSDHGMDLYLGDTYARYYPVGLGADDGTPTGRWKVGTKLVNPTYYPPRGGNIIPADDPQNPLGEHWIALHGVGGEAVGARRYGIHGTIEEESIGRSRSLGCIRMYNADVAVVYTMLVEDHSIVEVVP